MVVMRMFWNLTVVMVALHREYTKNYLIVHFKRVNITCEYSLTEKKKEIHQRVLIWNNLQDTITLHMST